MLESAQDLWPLDAVEVGRVLGAWGVKGWIKVQPFSTEPQAFFSTKRWFLQAPEGSPQSVPLRPAAESLRFPLLMRVQQAKAHGAVILAQIQDVGDRSAAESLRGARVFVSRASFPTPAHDEFYWVDLMGLSVFNREGQELGVVAGLLDTGPHSVLQVNPTGAHQGDESAQRLIPFVKAYIDDVNLAGKRITVDWGLDY
jgi:16S rRNA processing protein RimM